jgi:hypothetical protein
VSDPFWLLLAFGTPHGCKDEMDNKVGMMSVKYSSNAEETWSFLHVRVTAVAHASQFYCGGNKVHDDLDFLCCKVFFAAKYCHSQQHLQ